MSLRRKCLLLDCILAPRTADHLSALDWDLLIRQARASNLAAELAIRLEDAGLLDHAPAAPRKHLDAALQLQRQQQLATHWELQCILAELGDCYRPLIVLKGAAYTMKRLPVARGRLYSDIDVLLPRNRLEQVESQLLIHGWLHAKTSEYDQQYYRKWMHEIPPMMHRRRGSNLDLHHAILPSSARLTVNTQALFDAVVPVPDMDGLATLNDADIFLHSATHLFHEGDFGNGLRDLLDLDALIRDFSQKPDFWLNLLRRAEILGLQRPLFYALRYATEFLVTPVPKEILAKTLHAAPPRLVLHVMDFCYARALLPQHRSCDNATAGLARTLLYLRSHWIRMPVWPLTCHLSRKAWLHLFKPPAPDADDRTAQKMPAR
ncbi:MAG: nucleotidyltransferase family protein [Burkholderiaceae bacterium]|nr:nucleotidyltransferase family protein [Roseateles sp.]MBV8471195.1 nucleotidyltransferase family protein [Burkholderiaceae bacterium]